MEKQTTSAIERAREYGIDISLLESNLRRTPTERMELLQAMADLHEQLKTARRKLYPELRDDDLKRMRSHLGTLESLVQATKCRWYQPWGENRE